MLKRIYILLAEGFEILETFGTQDVLKRCGGDIVTVSISDNIQVESSNGVVVLADKLLKETDFSDGVALVLPGGSPGYINLRNSPDVKEIVKNYERENKVIAAICGAPTVLSENEVAPGKNVTGHSVIKSDLSKIYNYTGENVTKDGKIITGIGAGHTIEFAFEIAKVFFEDEQINSAKKGMELI